MVGEELDLKGICGEGEGSNIVDINQTTVLRNTFGVIWKAGRERVLDNETLNLESDIVCYRRNNFSRVRPIFHIKTLNINIIGPTFLMMAVTIEMSGMNLTLFSLMEVSVEILGASRVGTKLSEMVLHKVEHLS